MGDKVVAQVTTELRPTVTQIVQATVSSAGIDLSDTATLLETILVQLRPVVLNEVQTALITSPFHLNADSLTNRIVLQLRPFVADALQKEVAQVTAKAQNQVVTDIKSQIEPTVLDIIKTTVSATGANLDNSKGPLGPNNQKIPL